MVIQIRTTEVSMWVLVMVTLIAGDVYSTTKLERYDTQEECESERARITEEMDRFYAGMPHSDESSYRLECRAPKVNPDIQL